MSFRQFIAIVILIIPMGLIVLIVWNTEGISTAIYVIISMYAIGGPLAKVSFKWYQKKKRRIVYWYLSIVLFFIMMGNLIAVFVINDLTALIYLFFTFCCGILILYQVAYYLSNMFQKTPSSITK